MSMKEVVRPEDKIDSAIVVALISSSQDLEKTTEYLDELEFLASTINIESKKRFTQRIDKPDKRTYVGKGKFEEIAAYIKAEGIEVVIFDDELSPSQVRNIETELDIKVYDRSLLILDIFLFRAQTAQAKTQVELARAQYLLPRLTRMWTHLERQRGGTGTRGGSGEQEIETDRRMIRDQISKLQKQLKKIDQQNETQRKNRNTTVRVALVGYTNVGKSSLMRIISKSEVLAENKLFATIDSTVRKVTISNIPFLLTDTVGFIRKLPHGLIECFKSTLDEVRECDILLHVVDVSHIAFEEHMEVVNKTLAEIKAGDKPTLIVFNKIDQLEIEEFVDEEGNTHTVDPVEKLKKTYLNKGKHCIFFSAKEKTNLPELRREIFEEVSKKHYTIFPNFMKVDYHE